MNQVKNNLTFSETFGAFLMEQTAVRKGDNLVLNNIRKSKLYKQETHTDFTRKKICRCTVFRLDTNLALE